MHGSGAIAFHLVVQIIFLSLSIADFIRPTRFFPPVLIYLLGWFIGPLTTWIVFAAIVRKDPKSPQNQYSKYKWNVNWWVWGIVGWVALLVYSFVYFIVHGFSSSPTFAVPLTDVEMRDYTLLVLWVILTSFFGVMTTFAALWEKIFDSDCLVKITGKKWDKTMPFESFIRLVE